MPSQPNRLRITPSMRSRVIHRKGSRPVNSIRAIVRNTTDPADVMSGDKTRMTSRKDVRSMKWLIITILLVCLLTTGAYAESITCIATEDDQSAVDVGGTQEVVITDALIKKTGGNASSADASSFRGVNATVRVYTPACFKVDLRKKL